MEQIPSFDSGSSCARRELGHQFDRPVPASNSAVIQQALLTRLRSVGIRMHKTISISDDVGEIARERLEPNLERPGIVKHFHYPAEAFGYPAGSFVWSFLEKARSQRFR